MEKQFVVEKAVDIDVMSLCNEAQACGADAIVIDGGGYPLLLIHESLLCSISDIFIVDGEHVGPSWGYDHVIVSGSSRGASFYPDTEEGDELRGWRARTVVGDLEVVRRQLAALRQMSRQVPVTVHSI